MKNTAALRDMAEQLQLLPRQDAVTNLVERLAAEGKCDADLAAIWTENLRFTYTSLLEMKYPELAAANGDVLPIDTVPPESSYWEHLAIDFGGYADWIGDDGEIAPSAYIRTKKIQGTVDNVGHKWTTTLFELERFAGTNRPKIAFDSIMARATRRAHDAHANWIWLFGDAGKNMPGLATHPQIPVYALARNIGNTSTFWRNKTNDEILADLSTIVRQISINTKHNWFTGTVFLPAGLMEILNDRRLGTTDGSLTTLGQLVADRFKGDESGQGKVTFKILREATAAYRTDPRPTNGVQSDTSGIAGDFILAMAGGLTKDEACFIRSRPFTQRPPQEVDLKIIHLTISGNGGAKIAQPFAFARFDFGAT